MAEWLELLLDKDFYLPDDCNSDEECSEGPSYLENDELYPQDLDALDRAIPSVVKMMK